MQEQANFYMIEVTRTKDRITITGHAGYAENGKDIVCAAVSALTETFIASVEELTADELKAVTGPGNAIIEYKELTERANVLLGSFFIGLNMIAATYPEHIKILSKH